MIERKCFLIDDDPDDKEIFAWAIKEANLDIKLDTAENGRAALDLISNDPGFAPDYIFLDLNMPLMGGKQFLQEINKMQTFKDIAVIIYSTTIKESDKAEMSLIGASEFVIKPSAVDDLVAILKNIIHS